MRNKLHSLLYTIIHIYHTNRMKDYKILLHLQVSFTNIILAIYLFLNLFMFGVLWVCLDISLGVQVSFIITIIFLFNRKLLGSSNFILLNCFEDRKKNEQ
uniref:Uncharacterized protein n=1 Tax=Cacopsylla melanoneura TaxID=428564 RepID=A0A8D8XI92_9HEMI